MWMPPAIIKLTNTHLIYFCEADCAAQLSELEMSRRLNDRSLTFWLSGLLPPPLPLQCSLSLSTFSLCCWWSDFMSTPSGWWSLAHHRLATTNLPLPESNNLLVFLVACVFFLTLSNPSLEVFQLEDCSNTDPITIVAHMLLPTQSAAKPLSH